MNDLDLEKKYSYRKMSIYSLTIILMEVLEHLHPDKCQQVLCNLINCLSDDGKLIITVPSVRFMLIEKHYQHFSVEQLKALVGIHYKVVSITGHLKTGFIRNLRKLMVPLDFFFLSLATRFPFVKLHFRFMKKLLTKIETCPPEQAVRLIAVCQKRQD